MTIDFKIPRDCEGGTIAVWANPSWVTPELVDATVADRHIAANRAILKAPRADYIVSIDANWPDGTLTLPAKRIVGVRSDVDALYAQLAHETVGSVQFRSNLLSAMRIAADMGAARIIVTEPDPAEYGLYGHDQIINDALAAAFPALVVELRGRGIEVTVLTKPAPAPVKKSWRSKSTI